MKKLPINKFLKHKKGNYVANFFKISVLFFLASFAVFSFTYLLPSTEIVVAEEVKWTPLGGKSIIEVHIANNGLVFIQGSRVESISGTVIIVSTSWKTTKMMWTVNTNGSDYGKRHFGTEFFDREGNKLSVKDIRVGDIIAVSGNLDLNQVGLTVNAEVVRTSY